MFTLPLPGFARSQAGFVKWAIFAFLGLFTYAAVILFYFSEKQNTPKGLSAQLIDTKDLIPVLEHHIREHKESLPENGKYQPDSDVKVTGRIVEIVIGKETRVQKAPIYLLLEEGVKRSQKSKTRLHHYWVKMDSGQVKASRLAKGRQLEIIHSGNVTVELNGQHAPFYFAPKTAYLTKSKS